MKSVLMILLYIAVVLFPLILSWFVGGPPRSVWSEIGSGLGVLAFAMILVEFVLSGRFKSMSHGVGMDVTMRFHQLTARVALVFALLHPLFYRGTPSGGPRPWDPTRQLTLTTDFSDLATGIAAYALLPSLVLLSIGRQHLPYKYEVWRLMHGIGAVAIAVLLLHHTTHAGRYGATPALTATWKTMTAIALGAMIYVYLIVPLWQYRRAWLVSSVTQLSPRQWEVRLEPDGQTGLLYKAGQFVWLNIGHSPFTLRENPFSLSSAPASGSEVSFLIKELGDFTTTIKHITPGTRAYLDGPFGSLLVDGRKEPGIALIAGGIGLAPLLGILRQMRLTDDPRAVKIVYGNRRQEQIICRQELDAADVTYVLSEPPNDWPGPTGYIDGDLLDQVFTAQQFQDWLFVLCGPQIMMDVVEEHLIAKGTPSDRILSESFAYD